MAPGRSSRKFNQKLDLGAGAYGNPRPFTKTTLVYCPGKTTSTVAIDTEHLTALINGKRVPIAGQVSITNVNGDTLLDVFVDPWIDGIEVINTNKKYSGISWAATEARNGACPLAHVEEMVFTIVKGTTLVGHAIENDTLKVGLTAEKIAELGVTIRDTQRMYSNLDGFGRQPALKKLCLKHLGLTIQTGKHSSVEDAQVTMKLYLRMTLRCES